ncbi:glycoside hydrolase family 3 N-terminal domain-containing protein [Agromyces larvae]|uniref:beta-glucosidase n=1 Tax=Agromyces larvae TaxID=2929802 RepID=A0ABY4BW78_9MICO|nr:glycoside hydrolase family 3 N-terminal domain-containing protein [Agromyces larvae]UOE43478.1 glycoside hydrolase family 3 C-terminal domain-containing protein [Agromyces larvae]
MPRDVRPARPHRRLAAALAALGVVASGLIASAPAAAADADLAQLGTITASAAQDDGDGSFPASNAIDGDPTTRWASGNGPDADTEFTAWLQSDLGAVATVTRIDLAWEAAFAAGYELRVATADPSDPASWTTVHTETAGSGGDESIVLDEPVQARYVRLDMLQRTSFTWDPAQLHWYGYSLFSFGVFGSLPSPAVAFDRTSIGVDAGDTVEVAVNLTNAATGAQTVRVTSGGGTAVAGDDYTALDETLTFAEGETTKTVSVATVGHGALAPSRTFVLTLSDPSGGLVLGSRSQVTVTLRPSGEAPNAGAVDVLADFEAGVPAGWFAWGSTGPVTPQLGTATDDTVPGSAPGNHVFTATVAGTPVASDWFGFTDDTPAADWSHADGFQFWFLGKGTGKALNFELKSEGKLFDRTVVDDTAGWRLVSVLFDDLRLKGNPGAPDRFLPSASTGYAVTLTGLGSGTWSFDDVAIFERAIMIDDFEGEVPVGSGPSGIFSWVAPGGEVTVGVGEQERADVTDNHVLTGSYRVPAGQWGGITDNLDSPQDWSGFRGIRLWWYASQPTNPASPTAGGDVQIELKDGGPDGEHAELWAATFKDNWGSSTSRWKLVELPFSAFTLGGNQPGSAETKNGTLDLTAAWGFALHFPKGTDDTTYAIDDVQVYGTPASAANATVTAQPDVVLVDGGDTAEVTLAVTTASGDPLDLPVTVSYANGDGTAEAGTHFAAFAGELTFPAGAESGSTQSFTVQTSAVDGPDEARVIPVVLDGDGARLPDSVKIVINAHDLPYLDASLPVAERVEDLLGRMSVAEKAGQMAQAERLGLQSPAQIADLALGSVLSGGGSTPPGNTPEAWADMVDGYQRQARSTALQIPLLYGVDAVHGHSNVLDATIFPHNTGLGATHDADLVEAIGRATAIETKATGPNWTFAPCLCVTRDERWGRSYESFGEDPALVRAYAEAVTVGLQGADPADKSAADTLLATAKHWVGDGGTAYDPTKVGSGYPIDQGITSADSLADFVRLHVDPYLPSIAAGVGSIMPSYSAVDLGDGPVRMHEHELLNTEVLKGELGFTGFLISDWEGIDKLPGGSYADKAVRSVNAGLDMAMAPYNFAAFISAIEQGVASGAIEPTRVDDAVRRILTQKFELGLFEQPFTDRSRQGEFGGDAHRAIARQAAAESQVLLKNDGVLPLPRSGSYYVAGSNADDLGNQMGGWTISWQGGSGDTTAGTSILEGIRQVAPGASITVSTDASAPTDGFDAGIVVVGETPYAEGQGDVGNNGKSLDLKAADRQAIDRVCSAMDCVVLVVAGRTQLVTDQLGEMNALVSSFLPGSEGAGVADVLFGDVPFTGRLPITWPASAAQVPINVGDDEYEPLFAFGWGERTDVPADRVARVADALDALGAPDAEAADAVAALRDADVWAADGTVSPDADDVQHALDLLAAAAATLPGTERGTLAHADLLVSVARDLAQHAIADGTAADLPDLAARTADAEVALLNGDPVEAVRLLASVLGIELDSTDPTDPGKAQVAGTLSASTARVGDELTFSAIGFVADETLVGTLFSDPVDLGTVDATEAGIGSITFTVPEGLDPGTHTVQLEGSAQIASATFTLLSDDAPGGPGDGGTGGGAGTGGSSAAGSGSVAMTGVEIWLTVLLGIALVAAGAILMPAVARRRR